MAPFQLYVWPQRLLKLGPAYASAQHRHHAAQMAFGLDGPVIFESPQTGLYRADMLLISPNTPHAHPVFGALAFLYFVPRKNRVATLSRPRKGRYCVFFLQPATAFRCSLRRGWRRSCSTLVVRRFDWKVCEQCLKRRCPGLSCCRDDQTESRRADHIGRCGEGCTDLQSPAVYVHGRS